MEASLSKPIGHIMPVAELATLLKDKPANLKVLDCSYFGDGKDPLELHNGSRIPG